MKKILIPILLIGLLLTGCSVADPLTDTIYFEEGSGISLATTADLEIRDGSTFGGFQYDIVQTYINGVSENDTIDFVFSFEPTNIVLSYSAVCSHSTFPYYVGHTTGHSLVLITAPNSFELDAYITAIRDENGTMDSAVLTSEFDALMAFGGYDGSTYAKAWGVITSWATATHTLSIKFHDVVDTRDAFTFFEIMAIAYE